MVSLDGVLQAAGRPRRGSRRRLRVRRLVVQLLGWRPGPRHEGPGRQGPRARARPQDLRDLRGVLAVPGGRQPDCTTPQRGQEARGLPHTGDAAVDQLDAAAGRA